MNVVDLHPTWNRLVDAAWIAALDETPFLSRCRSGAVTRAELHGYVRQQFYYSRHFTRYLCALLANVVDDADRQELTKNLFEEMGLGTFGAVPHSSIYRNMMALMNVSSEDEVVRPGTKRLIATMVDCCAQKNPMAGLAALGLGAEAIVPHVYSQIIMGFEAIGEPAEHLEFFHIHVEGDDAHAVTMRNIIDREIARDPAQQAVVRGVARRVIAARIRFFGELTSRPSGHTEPHCEGAGHATLQL